MAAGGKQFDEYNALMSSLKVSVSKHLLDEHFTMIWANDFYYEIIKYPKDEYEALFHNHADEFYKHMPDRFQRIREEVEKALAEGRPGYECICEMPQKGGTTAWTRLVGTFTNEFVDGYPVVYTVFTDITDVVEVRRERTITYDNLPGFAARFRIDVDNFVFLSANDKFIKFFGCTKGQELSYGLSNYYSESNRMAYDRNFLAMRRGNPVHFTLQAKDQDGRDVWLQINADCISWQDDNPVYLVIYIDITDLTEQRLLQKQLEERSELLHNALEAAEEANRAKSEFLSRMSHDIRTPMNAIIGMTAIAASHIDNQERVMDCLEKINVSSRLLLGLINEVLDMSRIESGRVALTEEEFSMGGMIHDIITIIQPSIEAKHHTFDVHAFDLEHEYIVGDLQHLQQVFLNILSNAVKYTPDYGRIQFDIRELPHKTKGYGRYEFICRDNGYGMKPEFMEKLFMPFERAEDPDIRGIQGTGLGMAISRNIVRMMDGDIKAESTYGKGSTFTISLSLQYRDEENTEFFLPERLPVLVVDDDPVTCETVCERLDEIGLDGRWVTSGKEAVSRVTKAHGTGEEFIAIIIDLKMPEMNGIETAKAIRTLVGPDVPIILLSAYDWTEYEEAAAKAGVSGCIVKPLLKSSLVCAVKKYVLNQNSRKPASFAERRVRSFEGKRLLLVEDNLLNQEIAAELLGQTGAVVDVAQNGQEAVQAFLTFPMGFYDLIFMDMQMPVMNGLEAVRTIRAQSRPDACRIPIVAMTANALEEDVRAAKEAGMNDHLAKPLDIERMNRILERYLYDGPI
ncbi:response regulator [Clostridium sp. AM58-1XD]|nr:response regulator [Clostridium sp. AM58-1XD]